MKFLCRCGRWLCTSCPDPAPVDVGRRFFLQAGLLVPVAASVTVAGIAKPTWEWTARTATIDFGVDGGLVITTDYVYLPAGTYMLSQEWTIPDRIVLVGAGTPKGGG